MNQLTKDIYLFFVKEIVFDLLYKDFHISVSTLDAKIQN